MFYDLNVPWTANDTGLPRTLNFLHELGYNVVALNYAMSGKLPNELVSAVIGINLRSRLTGSDLRDTESSAIQGSSFQNRDQATNNTHTYRFSTKCAPQCAGRAIRYPGLETCGREDTAISMRQSGLRHNFSRPHPALSVPLQIQDTLRGYQIGKED